MKNCIYCGKTLENEAVCPSCGKKNQACVQIEDFSYHAVPAALAEEIAAAKVGLLNKGDAKKLAEAVRNSQAQIAEAVSEKVWQYGQSVDEDTEIEYTYANLADVEGRPVSQAVEVVGGMPQEGETVVIFRYFKKKSWIYALFTKSNYEQFTGHIAALLAVMGDGTRGRDLPTMEGSVADKIGGFLGGLFSKKKK